MGPIGSRDDGFSFCALRDDGLFHLMSLLKTQRSKGKVSMWLGVKMQCIWLRDSSETTFGKKATENTLKIIKTLKSGEKKKKL